MQFNNKTIIIILVILLTGLGFLGLKKTGLHIDGFNLVKGGSILLPEPDENIKIFLDNKEVGIEELENVAPGVHSIILATDTLWPWKKDVLVVSSETSEIFPFLISKGVSGEIISQQDPEYGAIRASVLGETLPTTASPLLSDSSLVEVWSDQNNIFARWNGAPDSIPSYFCNDDNECSSLVKILESESDVRNVDFYKSRDDVILVASQNGIFAIELDKRGATQNFQPVYKGTASPRFTIVDENGIYVLDGPLLFLVSI